MEAREYAKFFISKDIGANACSFESNMKLQKLLFFANLISLTKYDRPLFDNDVCAFENGCVVDDVMREFRYRYEVLVSESYKELPSYTDEEQEIMSITMNIFGDATAGELSEINHQFGFWRRAYENSYVRENFKDKAKSIVTVDMMRSETAVMKQVIEAYELANTTCANKLEFNGVTFYYDDDISITPEIREKLISVSLESDCDTYSFYCDNGELVVY